LRRPQTTSRKAARRPQSSHVGLETQDLLALCISLDTLTGSALTIQHLPQYAMRILRDFQGLEVRLTEERLEHVLEHPEMSDREAAIEETLHSPEQVLESLFDSEVRLYYRFYRMTEVGDKYLCVVVKMRQGDAFVLTAYLTDSIKRGWRLWPETE
jgi:hypothetical protein